MHVSFSFLFPLRFDRLGFGSALLCSVSCSGVVFVILVIHLLYTQYPDSSFCIFILPEFGISNFDAGNGDPTLSWPRQSNFRWNIGQRTPNLLN